MTVYLTMEDLLALARVAVGPEVQVRDIGLLDSALARPRASAFGQDAYPDLYVKAAALMHSLCNNHALIDGNKRLAWATSAVFLRLNDIVISAEHEDEQFDLIIAICENRITDLDKIAGSLRRWRQP